MKTIVDHNIQCIYIIICLIANNEDLKDDKHSHFYNSSKEGLCENYDRDCRFGN